MDRIILLETSTALCSTALIEDGKLISYKENNDRQHASLTTPFVKEMLDEHGLTVKDCNAVCVSMGPGSYTGLRVGVSTAKGLCFGADLPLIAVGSLNTLAHQAIDEGLVSDKCKYIIPMIDARRMEVYTAIFDRNGKQLSETKALIIDSESFAKELEEGEVLFIGDGAEKCKTIITDANARFHTCCPKASAMKTPATEEFIAGNFKDLAYFEPFYLKEFIATVSNKKLF